MTRLAVLAALVPLLAVLGLGTVERTAAPWRGTELIGPIYGTHVVTQPFTPAGPVLTAIDVRLATYARRNDGVVTLRLRRFGGAEDLRTASVPAAELRDSTVQRFRFPPVQLSELGAVGDWTGAPPPLEFRVESSAPDEGNAVAISGRQDPDRMILVDSAAGPNPGVATLDGIRQNKNVAFAMVTQQSGPEVGAAAIVRLTAGGVLPILGVLVLVLPGLLLARLLLGGNASAIAVLAATPAFALAAISVVTLWTGMLGAPAGPLIPAVMTLASLAGLLALGAANRRDPRRGGWRMGSQAEWCAAALALGAVGLGLAMRAVALDDLATPPGADSYHHAMITQLIIDHGGVPASYAPYAPIDSYAYHFGFHAAAAWLGTLLGWSGPEAVAMVGPLLNCLAALSIFGFVLQARLGPVAAAVAAVVTALVSPFPTWFLDVGRYPQEAALTVFPISAAFVLGYADRRAYKVAATASSGKDATDPGVSRGARRELLRPIAGGALLAAGLFLCHYRIALMLLVLVGVHLLWTLLTVRGREAGPVGCEIARCLGIVFGAALLVSPWTVRLAQAFTLGIRGSEGRYAPDYYNLERLGTALSHPALVPLGIVAGVGVAIAIASRVRLVGLLALWGALLIASSNPRWLPVPGAGALDSVTVVSSLYVVVAIAVGYLAQRVWDLFGGPFRPPHPFPPRAEGAPGGAVDRPAQESLETTGLGPVRGVSTSIELAPPASWHPSWAQILVRLTLLAGISWLAAWGALRLPTLVRPEQSLAAAGDLQAARWIDATLPKDARFLVNASVVNWEPDFVEPTDGGSWLPLLAHRATTLLPLVYAGERGVAPADIDRMERIARAARADVTAPATIELLRESGVNFVYLGVYGGPIDEFKLAASPAFRRVYAGYGVSIYELQRSYST